MTLTNKKKSNMLSTEVLLLIGVLGLGAMMFLTIICFKVKHSSCSKCAVDVETNDVTLEEAAKGVQAATEGLLPRLLSLFKKGGL